MYFTQFHFFIFFVKADFGNATPHTSLASQPADGRGTTASKNAVRIFGTRRSHGKTIPSSLIELSSIKRNRDPLQRLGWARQGKSKHDDRKPWLLELSGGGAWLYNSMQIEAIAPTAENQ